MSGTCAVNLDHLTANERHGRAYGAHGAHRARSPRGSDGERGQATVELLAVVPLLLAVAGAVFAFLAAGGAREAAASAAQAGAMAMLQDADPADAARRALRVADAGRGTVEIAGRRVRVTVRPGGLGPLAGLLESTSSAEAGAGVPAADHRELTVRGGDGKSAR